MKIKLKGHRLDEESDLGSVVNNERYFTQGRSFLTRMSQLKNIDRILRGVGFERMQHHVSIPDEMSDLYGAILGTLELEKGYYVGMQTEPYGRYSSEGDNNSGTIVEISPTYAGRYRRCSGLDIRVAKKGTFEDYVWTCNLFRKMFGLNERSHEGERK